MTLRKFENLLMKHGKKEKASKLIRKAVLKAEGIGDLTPNTIDVTQQECEIQRILQQAISNVQPMFATRKQRLAGRVYEIPVVLPRHKQESIAIRWIIAAAKQGSRHINGSRFETRLSNEIAQALLKQGEPYRKKQNMNRFAESNKNLVRYRL